MNRTATIAANRHRMTLVAIVVAATSIAVTGVALSILGSGVAEDSILGIIGAFAFTWVGAVVLYRRPGEPVGRICLLIGVLYGVASSLRYVVLFIAAQPGPLPPSAAALALIGSLVGNLALLLGGPLLISRFPQRAASAWHRRLEDVLFATVALAMGAGALRPGTLDGGWIENVQNPLALDWIPMDVDTAFAFIFVSYGATYLVTTVGLVRRYVLGGSIVRAQIRWFAAAVAVSLTLLVLTIASSGYPDLNGLAWSAWIISLMLPPITICISILRYRLYDIDRIVSNAIGYGLVTVVLIAVFVVVNLALVSRLSPLISNEGPAVAASTLLVAALFNPLRGRVQRAVDRRFHRAHYDAERMVADFAIRLRDELDLPTLTTDLSTTTALAVQPTSSALWLRARGGR